jgi:hypothetical protein
MLLSRLSGTSTHTPDQLKFHQAMKSHGGRFPRELLPSTAKALPAIYEIAQALISRANQVHPRLPRIHFDFINSNTINGVACTQNGEYFIGITAGTVTLLQLVIHRMLADPTLFLSVGDPTKEAPNPPHVKNFTPDAKKLQESDALVSIPKDEVRWTYSCRLINLSAMFLAGHEIAHIACGHVDYLASNLGTTFLKERNWSAARQLKPLERQVMECQADQYSFAGLLGSAHAQSNAETNTSIADQQAKLGQLVFDYSFAANTLFRLFGDERFVGKDLVADSYPPFALRRAIIYGGGCELARRNWMSDQQDVVVRALEAGMFATEHAFTRVIGERLPAAGLQEALSEKGRDHFKLIAEFGENEFAVKLKSFVYERNDENAPV